MVVHLESYASSPQVKLINECDRGMVQRDLSLVAKQLHKHFRFVTHPRSLGKPPMNRDEYLAQTAEVLKTAVRFDNTTYHSIVESPGKVVLHYTSTVTGLPTQNGTDESIWIIEFVTDDDGSLKIKQMEQFADTKNHVDLFRAAKAST